MTIAASKELLSKLYESTSATRWSGARKLPDWKIYVHDYRRVFFAECKEISNQIWSKPYSEIEVFRQLQSYWRNYSLTSPSTFLITEAPEVSVSVPKIASVRYKNRENIYRVLSDEGKIVLDRILELIHNTTQEQNWPLKEINIQCIQDSEIEDWQYILIILAFACELDTAYEYLNIFYGKLDEFCESLTEEQEAKLRELMSFDVQMSLSGVRPSPIP